MSECIMSTSKQMFKKIKNKKSTSIYKGKQTKTELYVVQRFGEITGFTLWRNILHQISNSFLQIFYTSQHLLFAQQHQTLNGMRSGLERRKYRWWQGRQGVHYPSPVSHEITASYKNLVYNIYAETLGIRGIRMYLKEQGPLKRDTGDRRNT